MSIDTIGGAGHQRAIILAGSNGQCVHLFRLHDQNLIDFISQQPVQHGNGEGVSLLQLIQVGEQPGAGQPPVRGQHAMAALPADGQAAALQMAHGHVQHIRRRTVIDGQFHADSVDVDIAHDAHAVDVQDFLIIHPRVGQALIFRHGRVQRRQRPVIVLRLLKGGVVIPAGHAGQRVLICADGPGLVQGIPVIARRGIEQDTHAQQKHGHQQQR